MTVALFCSGSVCDYDRIRHQHRFRFSIALTVVCHQTTELLSNMIMSLQKCRHGRELESNMGSRKSCSRNCFVCSEALPFSFLLKHQTAHLCPSCLDSRIQSPHEVALLINLEFKSTFNKSLPLNETGVPAGTVLQR